jgi:hypothetical protein
MYQGHGRGEGSTGIMSLRTAVQEGVVRLETPLPQPPTPEGIVAHFVPMATNYPGVDERTFVSLTTMDEKERSFHRCCIEEPDDAAGRGAYADYCDQELGKEYKAAWLRSLAAQQFYTTCNRYMTAVLDAVERSAERIAKEMVEREERRIAEMFNDERA